MKILSFDVSGNYSSISFLNNEEVNTFTQTHDRKERPDWDKLFERIGFDSDLNEVTIFYKNNKKEKLFTKNKSLISEEIVERVNNQLN